MEWQNLNNGDVGFFDKYGEFHKLKKGDAIIDDIIAKIRSDYPEAYKALKSSYKRVESNFKLYEYLIAKRFLRCNMGSYDTTQEDMTDKEWNLEIVQCPMRGECKLEGIVCRPTKASSLSKREVEIILLAADGHTQREIAEKLFLSDATIHRHIDNILRKVNARNMKQAIMMYSKDLI